MDFFKNFMKNDKTVVGLCDLKRRQVVNSFNFAARAGFNRGYAQAFTSEIPGGLVYAK